MKKYLLLLAFLVLVPGSVFAASPAFIGQPKTQGELLRCEIVKSKYSGKVYKKGDKAIKTMAAKWALCLTPDKPKVTSLPVVIQKTAAQIQLENEARNMALYGNPIGPTNPESGSAIVRAQTSDVLTLVDVRTSVTEERVREIAREEVATRINDERQALEIERMREASRREGERLASLPSINSASADKTVANLGDSVAYSWSATNVRGCTISNTSQVAGSPDLEPSTGSLSVEMSIPSRETRLPFLKKFWVVCVSTDGSQISRDIDVQVRADLFDGEIEKVSEYKSPNYQVVYRQPAKNGYKTLGHCVATNPEWGTYTGQHSQIRVGDVNSRSAIPGLEFACRFGIVLQNSTTNSISEWLLNQDGTPIVKEFSFTVPE